MANKKISDLTAYATPTGDDLMEIQRTVENITKKATITQVTATETAARVAQDNVIEAGVGLNANGTFTAAALTNDSWWLRPVDFTTGLVDRAGAEAPVIESIVGALRLLDYRLYQTYALVSGISSDILTAQVTISAAQMKDIFANPIQIIPTPSPAPSCDWFVNVLDAVAWCDYSGGVLTTAAGGDTLYLYYTGFAGDIIGHWSEAFIETADDMIQKWTYEDNYELHKTKGVKVSTTTGSPTGVACTSTFTIRLTYQLVCFDEGTTPPPSE